MDPKKAKKWHLMHSNNLSCHIMMTSYPNVHVYGSKTINTTSRKRKLSTRSVKTKCSRPGTQSLNPILLNDQSQDPVVLVSHSDNTLNASITLYPQNKYNILDPNGCLADNEIMPGQNLLKWDFNYIEGPNDTSIPGQLINVATSEFVQIVNKGLHALVISEQLTYRL